MYLISSKIATVINFCSNDYPFLKHCIEAVSPFSSQVIVPVCDHYFDGVAEDQDFLQRVYAEHPDVLFIQFPFDPTRMAYAYYGNAYWHNIARLVGTAYVSEEVEYVLYLDCDEIAETERFMDWLRRFPSQEYSAIRFATYWYFRERDQQALNWEDMPLLIRKELLNGSFIMKPLQRCGMHDESEGNKVRMLIGLDGLPLFHHYSFVRTKEQMLRKVLSWGHNRDRDWVPLVEEEFLSSFKGEDFVRGYRFKQVSPYVPIDLQATPQNQKRSLARVLTRSDVYKIEIELTYQHVY